MTSEVEHLEVCPFCGCAEPFVERADYSSCYVICNDCGARGPSSCDENEDDANASENDEVDPGELPARRLWNRRHTTSLSQRLEAAETCLAKANSIIERLHDFDGWGGRGFYAHEAFAAKEDGLKYVAALRAKATPKPCAMGVGCEEYGVCYASAHGRPDMCERDATLRADEGEG